MAACVFASVCVCVGMCVHTGSIEALGFTFQSLPPGELPQPAVLACLSWLVASGLSAA